MISRNNFHQLLTFITIMLVCIPCFLSAYQIGADDTLKIVVLNAQEISGDYTVSPDGIITLPMVGDIQVSKKDIDEIKQEITDKLSARIKNPEVYINISKPTNNVVYVNGLVGKSGAFPIKDGWGLPEIIAVSGDFKLSEEQNTNDLVFDIKSIDGSSKLVKYTDMLTSDYKAKAGDIIKVDIYNAVSINVVGKVNTPGIKRLSGNNNNIMAAIAMAGGFTSDANYSKVTIYDNSGNSQTLNLSAFIDGNNPKAKNTAIALTDNSTIVVPEIITGITVLGWVNKPGYYKIRPDEKVTLADVIALAGGGTKRQAKYTNIAVIRGDEKGTTRTMYNHNDFTKKGDASQNPIIKPGDVVFVPNTTSPDWLAIISALGSVINIADKANNVFE